jgi:uncharacterized protein with ParB-like and HNH nuclease domain
MKNQSETIRKFISYLNNENENGGFWLPNIQRKFVWKEEQIERLFDSILREYPIGTLLVWKTKDQVKRRKFIDNYLDDIKITNFYHTVTDSQKMLVLDGQQRLQSLFIGLKGSYNRRELFFNILSGNLRAPEDMKYDFQYMLQNDDIFPWIKFKKLVQTDKRNREIISDIRNDLGREFSDSEKDRIDENLELVRKVFCTDENIVYQEVDSIDRPEAYTEDDVVEIFIRANSGGTPLGKSDLLFSLLISSWDEADQNMEILLENLNKTGYSFNRDFVLKTFLVLLDKGARYNVEKFRDGSTKENIIKKWDEVANAILDVKDFIYGKTFIRTDKTLPSYLNLIPLVYFRYNFPTKWNITISKYDFLLRTLLTGAFSGNPDNLIDKCTRKINEIRNFELNELFGVIKDDGRNLEISKETILSFQYGDKELHLLFNIWYNFNYEPGYYNNEPQVDHIFPQSILRTIKDINPETGRRSLMRYKVEDRDQIANLMLLTRDENGAGGKTDIPPETWFADKDDTYLDLHLIPKNRELWKIENYVHFIEERKKMIIEKFDFLLLR